MRFPARLHIASNTSWNRWISRAFDVNLALLSCDFSPEGDQFALPSRKILRSMQTA